ncbi:hypothetical protein ACJX0J_039737, partial [Zea mays]
FLILPGSTGILGNSVGMLSHTLRPMPVTPTALRWPPGAGSDNPLMAKPVMCLLCKGSYDRELAKLAAEQKENPASRAEAAKPGLPHWMQPSSDQPQTKEQDPLGSPVKTDLALGPMDPGATAPQGAHTEGQLWTLEGIGSGGEYILLIWGELWSLKLKKGFSFALANVARGLHQVAKI